MAQIAPLPLPENGAPHCCLPLPLALILLQVKCGHRNPQGSPVHCIHVDIVYTHKCIMYVCMCVLYVYAIFSSSVRLSPNTTDHSVIMAPLSLPTGVMDTWVFPSLGCWEQSCHMSVPASLKVLTSILPDMPRSGMAESHVPCEESLYCLS